VSLESRCHKISINTKIAGSEKNGNNKLKCWKFANNGYPTHHLCAQNVANQHQVDPKSNYLFKVGKFIYDLIFPVCGKHLRADQNRHWKIGKNNAYNRNLLKCLTSWSCSFPHITLNRAKSILWERRRCKISIDTKFDQIRAQEDLQMSIQKRSIEMAKTDGKLRKTRARSNEKGG
jgi:hypothetical protein